MVEFEIFGQSTIDNIKKHYNVQNRYYHNFSHIEDGLTIFPKFKEKLEDDQAFLLAWFFHDMVYEVQKPETPNEVASESLMQLLSPRWGASELQVQRASGMILATQHMKVEPKTTDEKYFVDLDLSILGRDEETFAAYDRAVRKEYGHLTDGEWARGRYCFLASIDTSKLFYTDYFIDRYRSMAEKNIKISLDRYWKEKWAT